MDKSRLLSLLTKYNDNACTKEELEQLEQWYDSLDTGNQPVEGTEAFADEMLMQFRQKLPSRTVPLYRKTFFRVAIAASILFMIVIGSYVAFFKKLGSPQVANRQRPFDVSAPSSTKAFITFSDGRKLYVDSTATGSIVKDGNVSVTKLADGRIAYNDAGNVEVRMNTLTVPKGSMPVRLLLADSTEMWLDAATTFTYPNSFIGTERVVELNNGQAYFEVAHNAAVPFKVKKGNVEVKVLGTHFNVSAFEGEDMKVTLLQGAVKVSELNTQATRLMKEGQQVVVTSGMDLTTHDSPNLDQVMAWKNGLFNFDNSDLQMVLRQLSRWYDISVEYQGALPKRSFGGEIQRNLNLSEMLKILEKNNVHFKMEEKKLIVMP